MKRLAAVALALLVLVASGVLVAHYPFGGRLPSGARADRIVVEKGWRRMHLMNGDRVLKSYWIGIGSAGAGPKTRRGDHRTPEGRYVIDSRNPRSRFHRALHVSYPNRDDRRRAAALGAAPGGDIMIHGIHNGFGWTGRLNPMFWVGTQGCIAVTDREIEEIWRAVSDGTPIEIRP